MLASRRKLWSGQAGFTIVELLIVIVIIGILAAIVIVAYNGITDSANRAMAASEVKQWEKLFELYRAQEGNLPALTSGEYYCLGTGFPHGYCRYATGPNPTAYAENTGAGIITELSKVGTPPQNSKKWQVGPYVGPFLYVTGTYFYIYTFIAGDNDQECGKIGLNHSWKDPSNPRILCQIRITR